MSRQVWLALGMLAPVGDAHRLRAADSGLDVRIVHYRGVSDRFRDLEHG